MDKQPSENLGNAIVIFFDSATLGVYVLLTLVVLALTLWFAWKRPSTLLHSVAETLGCLAFAWLNVSMLQMRHHVRRLGLSPSEVAKLFSGSRPDDPDRARALWWGWQFFYSIFAVLLSIIGAVITG
ncbi:MAG: hypothetical protein ACLQMT_13390 [Candidatus Acidiferrales bacterium]